MLEKISLSDREYEMVTKGIAIGVGSGILLGAIVGKITLFFALGGVCGVIFSLIYAKQHKVKKV